MPATEPQPAPREGLFRRLWGWLAAPELPQATQTAETPPWASPLMPSMLLSREAVSEANRPGAVAQAIRTRQLMDRICALNNANVTRDYGTRTEDLTHVGMVPPDLSHDDFADAKRLLGVRVVAP